MKEKPFSQACENNRVPILEVLVSAFSASSRVLEIGSGTGQHAVYFAPRLPHLTWVPSDLEENHAGIRMWIDDAPTSNLAPLQELDVRVPSWPFEHIDGVFTANTAHIMHWPEVVHMFRGVSNLLPLGGVFVQYGPFKYHGEHTSESNRRFDQALRARDPGMGLRDIDALWELADAGGFDLVDDLEMPANNRTLVWKKTTVKR